MKKEKIAFLNIPDATHDEIENLASRLRELNTPYTFVVVGGQKWETISRHELVRLLKKAFANDKPEEAEPHG